MDKYSRLAIRSVDKKIADDLSAVAKNKSTTLSALLRPWLRRIRDSYPENMRKVKEEKD